MKNYEEEKVQQPFRDVVRGEYTWCLHCERVYKTEKWIKNGWNCPGIDCDGGILDAHSWGPDDWPRRENLVYPVVPIEGEEYPLYRSKEL